MKHLSQFSTLCLFAITFVFATPAVAEKRVALVVGNSAYVEDVGELVNPENDAYAVAIKLQQAGYDTLLALDQSKSELEELLSDFETMLRGADVGVFFYAGHAFQVEGENYLVATDASLNEGVSVADFTVQLENIQSLIEEHATVSVVLIDACRDNPFAGAVVTLPDDGSGQTRTVRAAQGLAAVRNFVPSDQSRLDATPVNSVVAFAAGAGQVAFDADGTINSPFTVALLRHLFEPRLDVRVLLGRVNRDVVTSTKGEQQPQVFSQLGNFFSLVDAIPVVRQRRNLPPAIVNYRRRGPHDIPTTRPNYPSTGFDSSGCSISGANTVTLLDDLSWIDQRNALASIEALMASRAGGIESGYPRGQYIELEGASASEFHHAARMLGEVEINGQRMRIVFGVSYAYGRFGANGPERAFSIFEYYRSSENQWEISTSGLGLVSSYSDPSSDGDPRVIWIDDATYAIEFPTKVDYFAKEITYYHFVPMGTCFKMFESNGRQEFLRKARDWLNGR